MTETDARAVNQAGSDSSGEFNKEVVEFSSHCAYIRSVYVLATRIWRDCTEDERKLMEGIAPSFFWDLGQVLVYRCAVCRKLFERKSQDSALRPHKTPAGRPCYGTYGAFVRTKY